MNEAVLKMLFNYNSKSKPLKKRDRWDEWNKGRKIYI